MKIQLNPQLCSDLRKAINEHHNFTYEKKADFSFPNQRTKITAQAFNCISAALDRISDVVTHCNKIEISDQFGLCDFFNYSQTLIECIKILADIYDVQPVYSPPNDHDTSIFNQSGLTGNGNDEKYFTYLRSLCSVHPVETSRHPEYQGNQAEWCPYITSGKNSPFVLFAKTPEFENADFIVTVYRNDEKYSKLVPIKVPQLIAYVEKQYNHIRDIIKAVDSYNANLIAKLKNKPVKTPDNFSDYTEYLKYLQKIIIKRCGESNNTKVNEWLAIINANFENESMQEKLIKYQEELKLGISDIHTKLQNMELDYYCEDEPIKYDTRFIKNPYALEKLHYLEDSFFSLGSDEVIAFAQTGGSPYINNRMDKMLNLISEARSKGATQEDLSEIAKYIDSQAHTTNSEWARLQLKIIEPYFDNVVDFDYHLNDWFLHLQIEIAFWLISQRS